MGRTLFPSIPERARTLESFPTTTARPRRSQKTHTFFAESLQPKKRGREKEGFIYYKMSTRQKKKKKRIP